MNLYSAAISRPSVRRIASTLYHFSLRLLISGRLAGEELPSACLLVWRDGIGEKTTGAHSAVCRVLSQIGPVAVQPG